MSGALAFDRSFIEELAAAIVRLLPNMAVTKRLFTLHEAAEYVGRSVSAVHHLIDRGVMPVTMIGNKRQVDRLALDKLISDSTHYAT